MLVMLRIAPQVLLTMLHTQRVELLQKCRL